MEQYKLELSKIECKLLEIEVLSGLIKNISDKSKPRFKTVVESSKVFYLTYRCAMRLLIIVLWKLIGRSENNNIQSFIDTLLVNYRQVSWHHEFTIEHLHSLQSRMNDVVASDTYRRLKNARNKHIAHDDKQKHKYDASIQLDELWQIIHSLQVMYNDLYYHLFNTTVHFDFTRDIHELNKLHRYKLIRDFTAAKFKEFRSEGRSLGEFQPIHDIIFGGSDL